MGQTPGIGGNITPDWTNPGINPIRPTPPTGTPPPLKPSEGTPPQAPGPKDFPDIQPGLHKQPPGLGHNLLDFSVNQANATVKAVASGKLSDEAKAGKLMEFGAQIADMTDNQLLDVAKQLAVSMRDTEGTDPVLNQMMSKVLDNLNKPGEGLSLLKNQLRDDGIDFNPLLDKIQKQQDKETAEANGLADRIIGGSDPAKQVEDTLAFQKSLSGMSQKQLTAVARHLGDTMAKAPDKADKLAAPLLLEVLNKMKKPENFEIPRHWPEIQIPRNPFDKDPMPKPTYPWDEHLPPISPGLGDKLNLQQLLEQLKKDVDSGDLLRQQVEQARHQVDQATQALEQATNTIHP